MNNLKEPDYIMKLTCRVKIPTGPKCNAKCRFCYYWDSLRRENPPTKLIRSMLRYAKKKGIIDVDFSGGEPSIRNDLPALVSYARELGFREICVITNGIKLSDKKELKRLIDSGLTGLLCSIEGHTEELHEHIVQVPGSFKKVMMTIENGIDAGIRVRTNTTVNRYNYRFMNPLAKALSKLQPDAINLIMFNAWCSATELARELTCRYSDAAPYLWDAIDVAKETVHKVTVRYIPFCFMTNYEPYVCNLLQKKFDPDEWDDAIKMILIKMIDREKTKSNKLTEMLKNVIKHVRFTDIFRLHDRFHYHDREINRMLNDYKFTMECNRCRYLHICDGVPKTYLKIVGDGELRPVIGKIIDDPGYFYNQR